MITKEINIEDYDITSSKIHTHSLICPVLDKKKHINVALNLYLFSKYFKVKKGTKEFFNQPSIFNLKGVVKIIAVQSPLQREEVSKIFSLFKVHYDEDYIQSSALVATEYLKYGQLKNLMKQYIFSKGANNNLINPTVRSKIIYGVAAIMKRLHKNNILHQYMPDHVYLDDNLEPLIKLSTFSFVIQNELNFESDGIELPIKFFTPEEIGGESITFKSDVFTYSIFLYGMFTGKFDIADFSFGKKYADLVNFTEIGKRPEYREEIPIHYWELIEECWKPNPNDRPSFDEITRILKNDKFALTEFGMKTDLNQLQKYQKRIDNDADESNKSLSNNESNSTDKSLNKNESNSTDKSLSNNESNSTDKSLNNNESNSTDKSLNKNESNSTDKSLNYDESNNINKVENDSESMNTSLEEASEIIIFDDSQNRSDSNCINEEILVCQSVKNDGEEAADEMREKFSEYESDLKTKASQDLKTNESFFFDEQNFTNLGLIGESPTSYTYKLIDNRDMSHICKKVIKYKSGQTTAKDVQKVLQKYSDIYSTNHPCLCQAYGISKSSEEQLTTVSLFYEYIEYGLNDLLSVRINNTMKTKIVIDIVHAMSFLHKRGMMHRDLKVENVMFNSIFETKIVDFGMVEINESAIKDYSFVNDSLSRGTEALEFMSPEMIKGDKYDNKTDIYSFGVLLYFLFAGSLPHQEIEDKLNGKKISLPSQSPSISSFCINVISKCLSFDPSDRPSFENILDEMRKNFYQLADSVNSMIISKRDKELEFIEKNTKI